MRDQSPESSRARAQPDEILPRGTVVGRFIVQRTLGMGATGIVYAARDPELDRTIALKVLRRELADRLNARARFLREAQALARLSHPNVIAVYDVGADEDRTFIAMEYIAGHTLADWIATVRPAWPQIVAVLVKAGRGLAAAHAADLIHRDFKPANLLVGADGRVVVTDFGLARAGMETEASAGPAGSPELGSRASALAQSITTTGARQGTPRYMAPEQQQGQPADARADQYSFCLTLHEALDVRGTPAWLQRTLQRGLSARPEERFPSMNALLDPLTREPIRRRRRASLGLAVAVAGGVAIGIAAMGDSEQELCTGGREQVSAVWSQAVASQVGAAFAATSRPHAHGSARRVAKQLGGYTDRWAAMHRETCLATKRGELSPDLLDRRMSCLARRLSQVGSLLELFVHHADRELVDGAVDLVAGLEPLASCEQSAALLTRSRPPIEPRQRARLTELERVVDRAELQRQAGRPQAGADDARAVLEAAKELDDPQLAAQAGRVLGRSLGELAQPGEAREVLLGAQASAERAGDIPLATHLAIDLLLVVGKTQEHPAEARLLGELVEASLRRPEVKDDPAIRARLLETLGTVANLEWRGARAVELLGEALTIRRQLSPAVSVELANTEHQLGNALLHESRYGDAREHFLAALAIRRQLFGDDHPHIAEAHNGLGLLAERESRWTDARDHYLAAVKVLERLPGHGNYPRVLNNLGGVEYKAGNSALARKYHETALDIRLRLLGPQHVDVARSLHNLGNIALDTGDPAGALTLHRRALVTKAKVLGKDHPSYAITLAMVGEDLRNLGRATEALANQEEAVQVFRARLHQDDPTIGYPLAYQGLALADLGRRREAIPLLERALQMIKPNDTDRARAAFALARALEPRRPRSERIKLLTLEALTTFTMLSASSERDKVAAYLARAR